MVVFIKFSQTLCNSSKYGRFPLELKVAEMIQSREVVTLKEAGSVAHRSACSR